MNLVVDLCCGGGGWAEGFLAAGYYVVGFDIVRVPGGYPGHLILQDVRTIDGRRLRQARVIVASPPCTGFSRYGMPFAHPTSVPIPDLDLVNACQRIAAEAGVPMVLENVRGLQYFIGKAEHHFGAFYLWGDVPLLRPKLQGDKGFKGTKHTRNTTTGRVYTWAPHRKAHLRARIPFDLSHWLALEYLRR